MPKIDDNGVMRHVWNRERLERLYDELCNYIADTTQAEYNEIESAFTAVKISIHQRINEQ